MAPSKTSNNPLENLIVLVELIAALCYQILTKSVLILGIGSLIIIFLLYLFFKLFGLA